MTQDNRSRRLSVVTAPHHSDGRLKDLAQTGIKEPCRDTASVPEAVGPGPGTARAQAFAENGVAIVEYALSEDDLAVLAELSPNQVDRMPGQNLTFDVLNRLFHEVPALGALASELGAGQEPNGCRDTMRLVRGIAFNNAAEANWFVPWQQDRSRWQWRRYEVAKLETPADALKRMVTLRVYLDDCHDDDGAMEVLLGSHQHGVLRQGEILNLLDAALPRLCLAARGDIVCMRPLIVRRSQRARAPRPRRVLHLEFLPATMSSRFVGALRCDA